MASGNELKRISRARIKSAQILIKGQDWEGAAQMMGLALECALKAATCRSLGIVNYPEKHNDDKVPQFFMSHRFERLLLLSGLTEIFSAAGDAAVFNNWSGFVSAYPGEWASMRYNDASNSPFDQAKIEKLFDCLYGNDASMIKIIAKKRKW